MRLVLAVLLALAPALASADTCGELRATYGSRIQQFVDLVEARLQAYGSVPPNGLACTGTGPVHPQGAGTGVTLITPNWDAKRVDQCGDPTGPSWRDLNIQPAQTSPLDVCLDQYQGQGDPLPGVVITFLLNCNGQDKRVSVVVRGTELWRNSDDWQ